ncbi:MAG: oxygen-independent coproporphyrinogen III oxidase, partial [Paraglaciecola chathamensis]
HQGSALEKGLTLSKDDLIRQRVISDIMCNSMLDKTTISLAFEIDFDQYFADELQQLTPFVEDGLVTNLPYAVIVAPKAQLLLRSICMVFDAYLGLATGQKYSATI